MPRVSILIDQKELTDAINLAESTNTFANESALFQFICNTPWSKTVKDELGRSRELTPALIYNRVKLFKIPLKTVKGKKGNPNIGVKLTGEQKEKRIKDRPGYLKSIQTIRCNIVNHFKAKARYAGKLYEGLPSAIENLLKKHAKGSRTACAKLKCGECVAYEFSEAATCKVYGCPQYIFNPFLKSSSNPELAENLLEEGEDNEVQN